jgi:MFS transporter, UMF1 family
VTRRLRPTVAWTLYDFGNSAFAAIVLATIFPVYYAHGVVGQADGRGDLAWTLAISLSMGLVALISPVLGGIADHAGIRKPFLVALTLVSVAATALLATVTPGLVVWGFVLAVAAIVTFETAFVFYNAYLPQIVDPSGVGRLSAAGYAIGYVGSIVAFAVAFPFVRAEHYRVSFVTTALQFGVFALPAFFVLPADRRGAVPVATAMARGIRETLATLAEIVRQPERREMRRFLLAYFVYEDGVNTVITVSSLFAAGTLGFAFTEIIGLFLVVQVAALVGSAAWGRPTDTRGPKLVVAVMLVQWTAVTVTAYFVQEKWQFWIVAVLAGTGLGAIQAASRAFMSTLVPAGREAEFFGFYALVGKTGAILGPLVFGGMSRLLAGDQRMAILAIGAFFVGGLLLLLRVRAGGPTVTSEGASTAPSEPPPRGVAAAKPPLGPP